MERVCVTELFGPIFAVVMILFMAAVSYSCFWMDDRHAEEVMALADQDLPTPIHNLTFRFNQTDYDLVFVPTGDESAVTITPMIRVTTFASSSWKSMRGLTVAAPTAPIRFSGKHTDGYMRFEIGIERDSAYRVEYFDKPVYDRDLALGGTT